jgi:hypothetical protein
MGAALLLLHALFLTPLPKQERDFGTVAAHLRAASGGAGQILRVHNVKGMTDATRMFNALNAAAAPPARKAPREREEKGRDATAKKPSAVCDPYENGGKPLSYAQCEPVSRRRLLSRRTRLL